MIREKYFRINRGQIVSLIKFWHGHETTNFAETWSGHVDTPLILVVHLQRWKNLFSLASIKTEDEKN